MKLKNRTPRRFRIERPKVRLTDAEIMADLLYPAPVSDDLIGRHEGNKTNGSR